MKRLIVANELIDFQDGRFFNLLTPLMQKTREALAASGAKKSDLYADFCAQATGVIKQVTNMTVYLSVSESKEINAMYSIVSLTPNNVHSTKSGRFDEGYNRIKAYTAELAKKRNLVTESMVSPGSSRVYGAFADIPFQISVSSAILTSDKLTDRQRAFLIIHECGHAFNSLLAIAETCVMGYNLADAFSRMMKAERKDFKIILDDTSKKSSYDSPAVVREAIAGDKDAITAFRVYSCLMVRDKFAASFDPSGKFNMPSIETAADSFAIRHGGYREHLELRTAVFTKALKTKNSTTGVVSRYLACKVFVSIFEAAAKAALVSAGVASAKVLFMIPLMVGFFMNMIAKMLFGNSLMNIIFNDDTRTVNAADHAGLLKREMIERSKSDKLSAESLQMSLDLLDEANQVIKDTDKQEPAIIRVLDMLIRSEGPRAIKDYADAQASLISNELFLKAQELQAIA